MENRLTVETIAPGIREMALAAAAVWWRRLSEPTRERRPLDAKCGVSRVDSRLAGQKDAGRRQMKAAGEAPAGRPEKLALTQAVAAMQALMRSAHVGARPAAGAIALIMGDYWRQFDAREEVIPIVVGVPGPYIRRGERQAGGRAYCDLATQAKFDLLPVGEVLAEAICVAESQSRNQQRARHGKGADRPFLS